MQNKILMAAMAVGLMAPACRLDAQPPEGVPGLFGPRVVGQSLRPRPRMQSEFSRGGIVYGRAGQFRGIDATAPSLMFRGRPWQYRPPEVPLPQVGRVPMRPLPPMGPYYEPPMGGGEPPLQPAVGPPAEIPFAERPPIEEAPEEELPWYGRSP